MLAVNNVSLITGLFDVKSVSNNSVEKVMDQLKYAAYEEDLLINCEVWDRYSSLKMFSPICSFSSLLSRYNANYFWLCKTELSGAA